MSSIVPRTRWAVRGPGAIARRFAGQLPHSDSGVLVAVGSSSPERARALAQEFPPRAIAEMRSSSHGLEVQLTDGDIAWLDLRAQQR